MSKPQQIFSESDSKRWLNDETVVWRYVPLRTLFFYLNGLVFIPSVAKLRAGDPFEGEFYEEIAWFNAAFSDHYENGGKDIDSWILKALCSDSERKFVEQNGSIAAPAFCLRKRYFEFIRRTRFAWCWFQSYRESAAMWSNYGNQGVAIQTTVGKLSTALEQAGRNFIYGRMTYVDYTTGTSEGFDPTRKSDYRLLLRPFFLKRKEYESEAEVRFVTAESVQDGRDGILLKRLLPQNWISAIRLWPGLTIEEEKSLQETVKHFLPHMECKRSELFSGPNDSPELISMIGSDLEDNADSNWKNGGDGIPAQLKEL